MTTALSRLAVTAGCVFLVALVLLLWRKVIPHNLLKENNEFAGFTYSVFGAVYGVFLAFTVFVVWGQFDQAGQVATQEAVHLSEVWRDVNVLAPAQRDPIHQQLIVYARDVIDREWAAMGARYAADPVTSQAYEDLWRTMYGARSAVMTPTDEVFFSQAVEQMNELGMQRRLRILASDSGLPGVLWIELIGGGGITILFTLLIATRHAWTQVVVTCALAALITFTLVLLAALQHPFSGDVRVQPEAFQSVLHSFEQR